MLFLHLSRIRRPHIDLHIEARAVSKTHMSS